MTYQKLLQRLANLSPEQLQMNVAVLDGDYHYRWDFQFTIANDFDEHDHGVPDEQPYLEMVDWERADTSGERKC